MAASERVRALAVVLAAIVALSAFAGPAAAVTGDVDLDAALDNQQKSEELTFEFVASQNGSVDAPGSNQFQGGDVVFEFESWNDRDSGASGSSSGWTVENGHTYEVTYEAQAYSGASGSENWFVSIDYDGGGTAGSETLTLNVDVLEPAFGGTTRPEETVTFTDDNTQTEDLDVEFENTGQGVMVPESVSVDSSPSGVDVSVDSLSDQVDAGSTGTASLDVSVDPSVSEGTYTISGTITDNLGNSQSFDADIDVQKPPVLSADDVDVGGVLRGQSETVELTVSETAGFEGIDGVSVNVVGTDEDGSVDVEGAGFVSTDPGGSDTVDVEVTANSDAPQHANLDWQIELTPDDPDSPTETIDVEGEVYYPANLGSVDGQGAQNVFDVPRSEADVQVTETTVSFENTGDLDMEVTDVSASTDSPDVEASIEDAPDTVGGLSTGDATVVLAADPAAAEGSHSFTVDVDTASAGSGSITRELTIDHVPELGVDRDTVDLGDVTVTNRQTTSVDVSEVLEYESVPNVEVTRVSGPDQYLTVAEQPTELDAGESAPLVFAISFDTSAELYEQYRWEFEVSGEGVETQTVTVIARPTPFIDNISERLSTYEGGSGPRAGTASGMSEALGRLESQLRDGREVPEGDLTETIAAGETALLLLESLDAADAARSEEGAAAAQEDVLRARATLNAMTEYVDRIESEPVGAAAGESLAAARTATDEQVTAQEEYYRSQLQGDNGEPTTLQRANANRQLARLAAIQGETERAAELNSEASAAFETYLSQVDEAASDVETARTTRASIRESATLVLFEQPLVLNPARLDPMSAKIERMDAAYASAAETYAAAGATQEADAVRTERAAASQRFQLTQYGLWGATGLYGLIVAGFLLNTGRNLYAYLQDRRTVQLGAELQ
ncbi:hypothetical protein [Halobellus ordinarius]|uniref:hypothetical protein n=1 Tax=Halobellus ordinarius TaxID=3075120 RepID=UPI00288074DF|nr:hypothetical protein [Halobellus sp. ZY16]